MRLFFASDLCAIDRSAEVSCRPEAHVGAAYASFFAFLGERGWQCECLPFAASLHQSEEAWAATQAQWSERLSREDAFILSGFSLGSRLVARMCVERAHTPMLLLGFPFHRHGDPRRQHGLALVQQSTAPVFIVQGERDAHGTRSEVAGYDLPPMVSIHWLPRASHGFHARGAAASEDRSALEEAAKACVAWAAEELQA